MKLGMLLAAILIGIIFEPMITPRKAHAGALAMDMANVTVALIDLPDDDKGQPEKDEDKKPPDEIVIHVHVDMAAEKIDELIDIANIAMQVFIVLIILGFAFWRRHFFLYIVAGAGLLVIGAAYMDDVLVLGLIMVVLGCYCLFRSAAILVGR